MLHHSNSRHQRNRGSRIKTLLQATLLVGVLVWLLYQVKHSYDKKNEYLDDTDGHLAHDDRSMFHGRKERVGSYGSGNAENVGENPDLISKPEEEKSGETVFDKENTESHEDDTRNTERSEADEGHVNGGDGNTEAHSNDEEAEKNDAESNSSDAESKSEVHSTVDDAPQNNHALEESSAETNGMPNEEEAHGDESTNADQTKASSNGSDGEEGDKKERLDSETAFESLSDDAKTGTRDEHASGTLPDETGNIPSVHSENSQNDASGNQDGLASTTYDASEHSTNEAVHIETGSENERAATSGTASGHDEKANSVESDSSDGTSEEENARAASSDDENGSETHPTNEVSDSKEAKSDEGHAATEVSDEQPANAEAGNSEGASAAEVANGSSEEAKPAENQNDGATETSNNGVLVDIKIETGASTNGEHSESQGGESSSGSNGSNDSGPEQTGKSETQ